jgi:hypothetical protein
LKGRLLFQPGVMVTSVPWQLDSSALRERKDALADRTTGAGPEAGTPEPEPTDARASAEAPR